MRNRAWWSTPLAVECAAYLAFALPLGLLGPGWPQVRHALGEPARALGLLTAVYGLGRLSTSASALPILARLDMRRATVLLCTALAATELVVAVNRSYAALVVLVGVVGAVSGCLDALGARWQSVVRHVGRAGLMFGTFGLGATLAPAVVSLTSWTVGFTLAAAVALVAAAVAAQRRVDWPDGMATSVPTRSTDVPVPLLALVLSLTCFAVYCGIEAVTGNWAATYLSDFRGVDAHWTGLAVSGFWAGMTLGRLLLGQVRATPRRLLLSGATCVLAVVVAVPLLPTGAAAAAFTLLGVVLAGMFPTLLSTTADRVGVAAAGRVTGWQLAVANLAGAVLSGAAGVLVGHLGPGAPILVLVVVAGVGIPAVVRATTPAAVVEPATR